MDLKQYIRTIPNFPKEGIMFRDITTLLQNRDAFRYVIDKFEFNSENDFLHHYEAKVNFNLLFVSNSVQCHGARRSP